MSTKSSLLLTKNNEHWYIELDAEYSEDAKTERCIVIEIDKMHKVETDEEGTRIIVEEGTELYKALIECKFRL